jgi:hypothetical protein
MRINETTLGLECEVTIRRKDGRDEEQVLKRMFFGLENTPENAQLIRDLERKDLEASGKNPDDYLILIN